MAAIGMTPEEVWGSLRRDWCGEWGKGEEGIGERGVGSREVRNGGARERSLEGRAREKAWFELVMSRREQLEAYATRSDGSVSAASPVVLVADTEPMDFLAGFWAGILAGWTVALANPNWATPEWQSTHQLAHPNVIWGSYPLPPSPFPLPPSPFSLSQTAISKPQTSASHPPFILIPTGGTSGQLKFTRHTWTTLSAAVNGFCNYFQPDHAPINTYCVLPLYHVSGLMQALRTWLTNGQIFLTPFKDLLSSSPSPFFPLSPHTYISLVPTQLSRLIAAGKSSWLRQFHAVLLGGAPSWTDLLDQAASHQIPICLSYGMTETGAMVTAMRSQDFFNGHLSRNLGSGQPMPHVQIQIVEGGQTLPSGRVGQIVVTSDAIAHGYYNAPASNFECRTFHTDDLGYLDDSGQLHVTGRASGKIISGGEKIFPSEVEFALRSSGQVLNVCILGLPDADWGEVVAAAYVPAHPTVSIDSLTAALDKGDQLSRYKYPKRWFALERLPENDQGKVNRQALRALLDRLSSQSTDDR